MVISLGHIWLFVVLDRNGKSFHEKPDTHFYVHEFARRRAYTILFLGTLSMANAGPNTNGSQCKLGYI